MWSSENDVILSAASYYMECKVNKLKSVRKPTSFDDPEEPSLFQLAKDDAYSKQCGKIFITINKLLIFHCAFCSKRYGTLFDFLQHIAATHLHEQKESTKSKINPAKVNVGKTMRIIELEPVQEHSWFGVRGNDIVEDKTNSIKKISKNLIVDSKPSSSKTMEKPMQNKTTRKGDEKRTDVVNVEETTEIKAADIDLQDEASISSLEDLEPIMYSNQSFKPRPYKCDKCDKAFAKKYNLTRHIPCHSNDKIYKCTLCEKTFKHKNNRKIHLLRHSDEKKFSCKVCDKRFYTSAEVALHKRMHSGERPYVCYKCGKDFKTCSYYNTHMKTIHLNIRDKKCDICSKAFFSNCQLRNHMAGHSDERPFACTQCSSTFARKKTLKEHIKLHTNARQYKCTGCDKSFNQSAALSLHKNNVHKI